jgi:hypothetical protein
MELVNMHNRRCLDTSDGNTREGLNPNTWDCHGGTWQKWFIDSEQRIHSVKAPNLCLTAVDHTMRTTDDPVVQLTSGSRLKLMPCTADGNKFQRWKLPGPRVGLQGVGASASAPPALPEPINRDGFIGTQAEPINRDGFIGTQAEPINRDGFADGGTQAEPTGTQAEPLSNTQEAEPLSTTLAQRTTDDAF